MRWVLSAGVALTALVSACGDDSSSPTPMTNSTASSTPGATVSPTLSVSPSPTPDPNLIRWAPDIELPDDMALIIEPGCWACDGPGGGPSVRVYRDSTGVRTEQLFTGFENNLPRVTYDSPSGPQEALANMTGGAATEDASVMAVGFCAKGGCEFSNGLGGTFDPESEGVAFRSMDGGVTWQEIGTGGPVFSVAGALADGRVLIATGDRDDGQSHYSLLPDNTPVTAPVVGAYPVTLSNEILWETNDGRLLLADGTPIFTALYPNDYVYYGSIAGAFRGPRDGDLLVSWMLPVPTPRPDNYVDQFALAEIRVVDGQATIARQSKIDGYLAAIGWWSTKDDRAVITIVPEDATHSYSNQSPLPAIVDLRAGTFSLIPGPFKSDMPGYSSLGRTIVHAVQTGPFARVTGTGSCLNIRTDPSVSGTVLTCAADGVLLRETSDVGAGWVSVMTTGGTQGWASAAFLER